MTGWRSRAAAVAREDRDSRSCAARGPAAGRDPRLSRAVGSLSERVVCRGQAPNHPGISASGAFDKLRRSGPVRKGPRAPPVRDSARLGRHRRRKSRRRAARRFTRRTRPRGAARHPQRRSPRKNVRRRSSSWPARRRNPALKREIVQQLSNMKSKEADRTISSSCSNEDSTCSQLSQSLESRSLPACALEAPRARRLVLAACWSAGSGCGGRGSRPGANHERQGRHALGGSGRRPRRPVCRYDQDAGMDRVPPRGRARARAGPAAAMAPASCWSRRRNSTSWRAWKRAQIVRLRSFTPECDIDAGGLPARLADRPQAGRRRRLARCKWPGPPRISTSRRRR